MEDAERQAAVELLKQFIAKYELQFAYDFHPSMYGAKVRQCDLFMKWTVHISRNATPIVSFEYTMGYGLTPTALCLGLKHYTVDEFEAIRRECETGKDHSGPFRAYARQKGIKPNIHSLPGQPIIPDSCDILYALGNDCEVINYCDFEDWASEFGGQDSISERKRYRTALRYALSIRKHLGNDALEELMTAIVDY